MRIIKFLIVILLFVVTCIGSFWYYVTSQVAEQVNKQYAGQQFYVKGIDKSDYFITFDKVVAFGFPYKIAWSIQGWSEESRGAKISYTAPIKFGYDLILQQAFITYDGEIKSSYKPEKHGFGSKLKIDDYNIVIDLPLTSELIHNLREMKDPVELINHFREIKVSTGKVEIFDLLDDEKFFDKQYEKMKFRFTPQKKYSSLEDLLQNIPQEYTIDYDVKTNPLDVTARRLPVSLFYGFSVMPSGIDIVAHADIKTSGNNINEVKKNLEIKASIKCNSPFIDIPNFMIDYKSGDDPAGRDYTVNTSSKLYVKEGMFAELFKIILAKGKPSLQGIGLFAGGLSPEFSGKMVEDSINYITNNKEIYRYQELENSSYDFNLHMNSSHSQNTTYVKIEDFSIFSEESGVRLSHEMETTVNFRKSNVGFMKGVLFIKNYKRVIELLSEYTFRSGFKPKFSFKTLSKEAIKLYTEVNTAFLKDISDHPNSTSKDLSIEYSIDLANLDKTQLGSVKVEQIPQLYTFMIYKKLFGKVGHCGDVLGRMKKILPEIDAKDPLLETILPKISGGEFIEKSVQKQIDKVIPSDAKKVLDKIIPKGKIGKGLLKNLTN